MIELELKIQRDAAGLIVGIGCRIGEGAAKQVGSLVDTVLQIERFLGIALGTGAAIEGRNAAAKLFEAYRTWSAAEGLPGMGIKTFARAMRAAGFEQIASNGRKWFIPSGTAARLDPRAPGDDVDTPASEPESKRKRSAKGPGELAKTLFERLDSAAKRGRKSGGKADV